MFKAKQLGKRKRTDYEPQNGTAIKGSNLAEVGRDVSNRRLHHKLVNKTKSSILHKH